MTASKSMFHGVVPEVAKKEENFIVEKNGTRHRILYSKVIGKALVHYAENKFLVDLAKE